MEGTPRVGHPSIKYRDLLEVWISNPITEKVSKVISEILELCNISECSDVLSDKIKAISETYHAALTKKWRRCKRNKFYLQKRYHAWLNTKIEIPEDVFLQKPQASDKSEPRASRGRPTIPFSEASLRTKRRRVQDLLLSTSSEELSFAATLSQKSLSPSIQTHPELPPHELVALYLDLDLSERKYCILRSFINKLHTKCLPNIKCIRQIKQSFLPTNITITETSADVRLQNLLNTTADSIFQMVDVCDSSEFTLICKWGFDGSSGHSIYKQRFTQNLFPTDEFLFVIALVPLQVVTTPNNKEVWVNTMPSSTFFCRPIKFMFMKENAQLVRDQESAIQEQIENLSPHTMHLNNRKIQVHFKLLFTMLDGSVTNILSNTNSTSKCYICGATPSEMNLKKVTEKPSNSEHYRFGLSTLHCWIRFLECLLHISYRLPFKKWQVRSKEHKAIFENTKKKIQEGFKSQLGLTVDKPKPGFATTNDGNTARRFFSNSEITAQITGIDKGLIEKLYIILRVLSCGRKIHHEKFDLLIKNTLQSYLDLYSWFYMPISLHKVLVHGCDVIRFFDLPIGLLSEEALEATHKEIRKNRLNHTRKTSRCDTNKDLFNVLLLSSDPLISCHRKTSAKKKSNDFAGIEEYLDLNDNLHNESDILTDYDLDISDTDSEDSV